MEWIVIGIFMHETITQEMYNADVCQYKKKRDENI